MRHSSIKVCPTKTIISIASHHIYISPITYMEDTNIKRSTTKVVHNDVIHAIFLIKTISQCCSSGFFEDTCDSNSGVFKCFDCDATLFLIKLGRNRNDG
mmetsp:Transcript_6045/g.7885  ORF Transcript_6045/g.7885 Transcript_6045/m.7885 type:complete len:99 (-) Transcript_6045:68-364(-)